MATKTKRQLAAQVQALTKELERRNEWIHESRARLSAQGVGNATLLDGVTRAVQSIDTLELALQTARVQRDKEATLREENYKMAHEYQMRAERAEGTVDLLLRLADTLVGKPPK